MMSVHAEKEEQTTTTKRNAEMASCKRVPAYPLEAGAALLDETAQRLASEKPLTPEALDGLFSTMATLRREIHANPEPGFEEVKTQALLKRMLIELAGVDPGAIKGCAKTGLVVDIKGKGSSKQASQPAAAGGAAPAPIKVIALRADMDALRMTEGNNGLPYKSTNNGVAHLCGHDGHMASLIGAATLISKRAERLPSDTTVRLLFQPAEEGPGGAAPMIEEGCLDGVDECYGYHNWPPFKLGSMHVCPGPLMAHPTTFDITIKGKGGHGSQPQFAVDPVLVSAHVIVALQSVVSRSVASSEQAVLSVTMVHGGEVFNVIPDQVRLCGTIRDLNPAVCETIYERVRAIVAGQCAAFGATGTVTFDSMYPVIMNHPAQTEIVKGLGRKLLGEGNVSEEGLPMMGAEDFSFFLQKVPGCFYFFGGNEAELNGWARLGAAGSRSNCMCHNTAFDFNDNVSPRAAVFFVRLVEERLNCQLYDEVELPMPKVPEGEGAANGGGGAREAPAAGGPIQLPAAKKARSKK
jgi:amidohydrolase